MQRIQLWPDTIFAQNTTPAFAVVAFVASVVVYDVADVVSKMCYFLKHAYKVCLMSTMHINLLMSIDRNDSPLAEDRATTNIHLAQMQTGARLTG